MAAAPAAAPRGPLLAGVGGWGGRCCCCGSCGRLAGACGASRGLLPRQAVSKASTCWASQVGATGCAECEPCLVSWLVTTALLRTTCLVFAHGWVTHLVATLVSNLMSVLTWPSSRCTSPLTVVLTPQAARPAAVSAAACHLATKYPQVSCNTTAFQTPCRQRPSRPHAHPHACGAQDLLRQRAHLPRLAAGAVYRVAVETLCIVTLQQLMRT